MGKPPRSRNPYCDKRPLGQHTQSTLCKVWTWVLAEVGCSACRRGWSARLRSAPSSGCCIWLCPHHDAKRGSIMQVVMDTLWAAGEPLHMNEIILRVRRDHGVELKRQSMWCEDDLLRPILHCCCRQAGPPGAPLFSARDANPGAQKPDARFRAFLRPAAVPPARLPLRSLRFRARHLLLRFQHRVRRPPHGSDRTAATPARGRLPQRSWRRQFPGSGSLAVCTGGLWGVWDGT